MLLLLCPLQEEYKRFGLIQFSFPYFKPFISDNIDRVTPRFSGMSLGDVMKVTVMQEMEQLNMERSKPLDLSCKAISFSMKN